MGMSAAQFFQVVLLPQGEFARFLRADAKDKEALLQKLFGTDRFRKVEDWLADRRRATEKEVAAAEDGVNQLVARIAQAAGGSSVPDSAAHACLAGPGPRHSRRRPRPSATRPPPSSRPGRPTWKPRWTRSAWPSNSPTGSAAARTRSAARPTWKPPRRRSRALARSPAALHAAGQEQQAQVGRLEALRAVARQADAEDETAATARASGRRAGRGIRPRPGGSAAAPGRPPRRRAST